MPPKAIAAKIRRARNRSVPLIAIETTDPAETLGAVLEAIAPRNGDKAEPPCFRWNCAAGTTHCNDAGKALLAKLINKQQGGFSEDVTTGEEGLVRLLGMANDPSLLAHRLVLVLVNPHRYLTNPEVIQAIWNLRDAAKTHQASLVILGPTMTFPPELSGDVMLFDDPLPDRERLNSIAAQVVKDAKQEVLSETMGRLVDAVAGLSAFQAEQVVAMSVEKEGVSVDYAWERKRKQIEQTPGLAIWRGGEKFADVGGVRNVKAFAKRILGGKSRPHGVVFVDEIEKAMAGARGDTSGVSQDILGVVLQEMQDNNAAGMIFIGPPGTSKSMVAKAAGNEAGVPTIRMDFGAMKGSLVGQSEQQVRHALKVVNAVTDGNALWIATCNEISELPPALRRRFTLGTFFFDLPDTEERNEIWKIWHTRYFEKPAKGEKLKAMLSESDGWTGAEIKQCADIMWRCGMEFDEAKAFVVPVSVSAQQQVSNLRAMASGRFLSASRPGLFTAETPSDTITTKLKHTRKMTVDQD